MRGPSLTLNLFTYTQATQMADPFTVIGLTASLITFVDTGIKLVSVARSLYDSGTVDELRELNLIVGDIRRKNAQLRQTQTAHTRELGDDELVAMKLAIESDKIAADLEKVLNKLKIRGDRSRTLEAMRVAIGQRVKKEEMVELYKRLLRLDKRVRENMKFALEK